jgi:methyl acetate hydrolase
LNGGITLGQYIERNIFEPLGLKDTTFHPLKDPHFNARLTGTFFRQPDGSLVCKENVGFPYDRSGNDNGGGGLFSNTTDYCKLLAGVFLPREGQPVILGEELVRQIFKPELKTDKHLVAKLATMRVEIDIDMVPHVPESCLKNFGLGVVLNLEELDTGLSAGSGQWSGYTNCYWVSLRLTLSHVSMMQTC